MQGVKEEKRRDRRMESKGFVSAATSRTGTVMMQLHILTLAHETIQGDGRLFTSNFSDDPLHLGGTWIRHGLEVVSVPERPELTWPLPIQFQ